MPRVHYKFDSTADNQASRDLFKEVVELIFETLGDNFDVEIIEHTDGITCDVGYFIVERTSSHISHILNSNEFLEFKKQCKHMALVSFIDILEYTTDGSDYVDDESTVRATFAYYKRVGSLYRPNVSVNKSSVVLLIDQLCRPPASIKDQYM